jgi:hypothetical protein
MSSWLKSDANKILLTEGDTDCHVIASLCNHYQLETDLFGFFSCGSDKKVLKKANALLSLDGEQKKQTIGIVLDADTGVAARWEAIKNKLQSYEYIIPDAPNIGGTILNSPYLPKLGIWLMPNNLDVGMLEDFCLLLVEENKIAVADECIKIAMKKNATSFKSVHYAKALIHTYLAWQDEPGKPIGQAITAKILEPSYPISLKFKNWLIELFGS